MKHFLCKYIYYTYTYLYTHIDTYIDIVLLIKKQYKKHIFWVIMNELSKYYILSIIKSNFIKNHQNKQAKSKGSNSKRVV